MNTNFKIKELREWSNQDLIEQVLLLQTYINNLETTIDWKNTGDNMVTINKV